MKTKLSKLIETLKTNKTKTTIIAVAAVVVVTGAVAVACAAANRGGAPMAPEVSEPSESVVTDVTYSEITETNGESAPSSSEADLTDKLTDNSDKSTTSSATSSSTVSSTDNSSKPTSAHKHSYTQTVVKPTCTKDGYTKHTCKCGKSYKDDITDKLGHLYLDWKVTKKATTTSTGLKECKCDRCGKATITETIPKKKKASNIDSRVEIGKAQLTNEPQYTFKKADVIDKRTWGEAPSITITGDDCMHVVYYNKKGKKIEFDVEQPVVKDTINGYTILDDGTFVGDYFGSFS